MSVCVCTLVSGGATYYLAARQALASVRDQTPFDAVVVVGAGPKGLLPAYPRLRVRSLPTASPRGSRAAPFLAKFLALEACLDATSADYVMLLDADTVVAEPLDDALIERALDGRSLAMVEQTVVRGSDMDRAAFLRHYRDHALAWIDPNRTPPDLEDFRYFNSGVVLGTREELMRLTTWALALVRRPGASHQIGQHMITDQDYFQFWANTLHADRCRTLGWEWNHCEHWDEDFPRTGARVLHFSNFCHGPTVRSVARMAWHRRRTSG